MSLDSRLRGNNNPVISSRLSFQKNQVREMIQKGIGYERTPHPLRHPSTSSGHRRLTDRARDIAISKHSKFKDLPIPKFVEPVETNPDVTSALAPHPDPLTRFDPSTFRPFDKLKAAQAQSLTR